MRIELPLQQVPARDEDQLFDDTQGLSLIATSVRRFEVEATAASARSAETLAPDTRRTGLTTGSRKRLGVDIDPKTELLELEYEELDPVTGQRRDVVVVATPENLRRPVAARDVNDAAALGNLLLRPDLEAERSGGVRAVLRAIKVLNIGALAEGAAPLLARKFEESLIGGDSSLRRCPTPGKLGANVAGEALDTSRPLLILLHGTASSTASSFGALDGSSEWQELALTYGENSLAFEHRTLTQDPLDNALQLVRALPRGARLHLLSHSRGGLVGDLLALATTPSGDIEVAAKVSDPALEARLTELQRLGLEKEIRVERFLRCACPARGTALMTKRLDSWASAFLTVLGLAFKGSAIYAATRKLVLQLVGLRAEPKVLPGLACMSPDSPLIRCLNTHRLSKGELAIIAGDARRPGLLGRLRTLLVDAFFREQNDLVVDTESMYGGAVRRTTYDTLLQDSATTPVNHWIYFRLRDVRSRVFEYLARGDATSLSELPAFQPPEARGKVSLTLEAMGITNALVQPPRDLGAPIVVLLPGIMGTHLRLPTGRVWLSFWALAGGGLADLHADATGVTPDSLMADAYARLAKYLQRKGRDVVLFPYDWRASLKSSATKLTELVNSLRDAPKRPIRLLAHSMGGLVARTMIADSPELWKTLVEEHDARLVMLGTPNAGSHTIAQLFSGQHELMKLIDHIDQTNDNAALSQVTRGFAGPVQMLPSQPPTLPDLFDPALWSQVALPTPQAAPVSEPLLKGARELRETLRVSAIDPEHMAYVAGAAPYTPSVARLANGSLVFTGTRAGDGTVTWESGRLPGVRTYYAAAEHGDLADFTDAFDAYLDLLDFGETKRLPDAPPASLVRRDALDGPEPELPQPERRVDLFPSPSDLENAALGRAKQPRFRPAASVVQLSVAHADARSVWEFRRDDKDEFGGPRDATAPTLIVICIGHGEGPPYPEAALDALVGHGIQEHLAVGAITGRLHTRVIVRSRLGAGPNVLVLGVGDPRSLTRNALVEALTSALLEASLDPTVCCRDAERGVRFLRPVLALSRIRRAGYGDADILTVGAQSVVQANRNLRARGLWDVVRIDRVLFAEDFEEDAIAMLRSAREAAASPPFALQEGEALVGPRLLLTPVKGDVELPRRPLVGAQERFWETWSITNAAREGGHASATSGELRLSANVRRARSEGDVHGFNPSVVERFVSLLTTRSVPDEDAVRYLRGHLLPDSFRSAFEQSRNILLTLDRTTAPIPWEMFLVDPESGDAAPAARFSMVRQLEELRLGGLPDVTTQNRALVVGPPALPADIAPELPRAVAEAEQVHALLEAHGYEVAPERPSGLLGDVIRRFHARSQYSIVHLCGHGQVDESDPSRTGLILADGDTFSSMDLRTWAAVPALVFLNCCHLGRTAKSLGYAHPQRLAASLAQACIQSGVRVVVAAGWAVNDAAAEAFSRTFYDRMLSGDTFGSAVASARMAAWRTAPSSLTWAAYQCYGDPHFVLPRIATDSDLTFNGSTENLASRRELEDFLRQMLLLAYRRRVDRRGDQVALAALAATTERAIRAVPEELWNGRLLYRVGQLWGHLGKDELAGPAFSLAATYPDAPITLLGYEHVSTESRSKAPTASVVSRVVASDQVRVENAVEVTLESVAAEPSLTAATTSEPPSAADLSPLVQVERVAEHARRARTSRGEAQSRESAGARRELKLLETMLSTRVLCGLDVLARPEHALLLLVWPELRDSAPSASPPSTKEQVAELYRQTLASAPVSTRLAAAHRLTQRLIDWAPAGKDALEYLHRRLPVASSPDDPNKGKFGAARRGGGYKLSVSFPANQNGQRYVSFTLTVEPESEATELKDPVTFHLHPTFRPSTVRVTPLNNRAELSLMAWGAFTVGAVVGEKTRLELDLAEDPNAPTPFRDQ